MTSFTDRIFSGDLRPFKSQELLRSTLQDKVVLDLGAGDLFVAKYLLQHFGVRHVLAVEKERGKAKPTNNVTIYNEYFSSFSEKKLSWDVAFLSWPANHPLEGLLAILERASTIVILSCNFRCSMTGWPELWKFLSKKQVVLYVPHHANSLTIYNSISVEREPTRDEIAGIDLLNIY